MLGRKRGVRDQEQVVDAYSWEGEMERPWENIEEDEEGNIKTSHTATYHRRTVHSESELVVRRGVIRYLYVVLDMSEAANDKDMPPSRLAMMLETLLDLISEFFDQNPLSQMGIILTRDSVGEVLCFSSNRKVLEDTVEDIYLSVGSGSPSVENVLLLAMNAFDDIPGYASKELLFLYNSMQSCDPGHIFAAIEQCTEQRIRCSVVGVGGEIFMLRKLASDTRGTYWVALNEGHYHDLVLLHVTPPPSPPVEGEQSAELILMGFPPRKRMEESVCFCHRKEKRRTTEGYVCPRCHAKCCALPTVCPVCSVMLVSSPHLARSYHHLFPLPAFAQVAAEAASTDEPAANAGDALGKQRAQAGGGTVCFGCSLRVVGAKEIALQCPTCRHMFCTACDYFIHNSLHNCPGCV
eukprot:NODE_847_length_1302_cov_72.954509_g621_i0.p1 GENE.NODE_847_length_1302_cov_72.954509_g621_i0~~NODE_847_length_1302_cov_72.954509_g621_i0.p1  ORF type:complete len:428 (+),score=109.67 NODE_847_length_1302_cov_72.954509_g621_i0:62-1285(+)